MNLRNLSPETIQSAMAAADRPIMLESPSQVSRAAKAWRRSSVLALDTEFVRERTYYAQLGLVQISDGQTVWLLDPLVEGTLPPFHELLDDGSVTKLLHSPSEDLDVLFHDTGTVPDPMVDTQMACALLGQPLQLGYHKAAEWLLGVEVDKELTRSNWCARPLRTELLRYAALDVCLLPMMWDLLRERLDELGRLTWLEEDCRRQTDAAREPLKPSDAWLKIKGAGRLDGPSLAMLKSMATWREKEARRRDRPRGFIVPDKVLLAVCDAKLRHVDDLETLEDLHPRARRRYGKPLINMVEHVLDHNKSLPTLPKLDSPQRHRLKVLRRAVDRQARQLELEPVVLASRKELEDVLLGGPKDPWPARLLGWRRSYIEAAVAEAG